MNSMGSYECKCLEGYKGDGFVCVDKDECNLNDHENSVKCPLNSKCVNHEGNYECVCYEGYERKGNECIGKIKIKSLIFIQIYFFN